MPRAPRARPVPPTSIVVAAGADVAHLDKSQQALLAEALAERGQCASPGFPAPAFRAQVTRLRARVTDPTSQRKAAGAVAKLPKAERKQLEGDLEMLRAWAKELLAVMRE